MMGGPSSRDLTAKFRLLVGFRIILREGFMGTNLIKKAPKSWKGA